MATAGRLRADGVEMAGSGLAVRLRNLNNEEVKNRSR